MTGTRSNDQDPTQPVEVQRYGPAGERPPGGPSWDGASAWSSRDPSRRSEPPPRRGLGALGIVLVAVLAGLLSGAAAAFAVVSILPRPIEEIPTTERTADANPVSEIRIDESSAVTDAVAQVAPAVVTIESRGGGPFGGADGTGSGFIYHPDGWILTNRHVVQGADTLTVTTNEGREYSAEVHGVDTLTDLAIVKIDASDLPVAPVGVSADLESGQIAIAIGNPLGYENTVTTGVISGLGRNIVASDATQTSAEQLNNLIQTDAAINPGNSGGPLVNSAGQVIGVNTAVSTSPEGVGIGFAIPIDFAKPIMEQAVAGEPLVRPWIGVFYLPIDPALAAEEGLPVEYGALLATSLGGGDPIVDGSPAERAGLRAGDVIVAVDGEQISERRDLSTLLLGYRPGDTITLRVLRESSTTQVQVTLGELPAD